MINSSAAFQAALTQDSRSFSARLLYNSTEVSGDIRKITIVKGSSGASDFAPGSVFCPYIEVIMDNCPEALEGKELELLIGLDTGSSVEEIRLGYFTVGRPSTSAYRTTFTAQGRISSKLSGEFGAVPQTLTIGNVASQIQTDSGVTIEFESGIDTTLPINGVFASNCTFPGMTDRGALEAIAQVVGGYATETADGTVRVCKFRTTATASHSAASMLTPPEFHDLDTEITGVKAIVSQSGDGTEDAYESGSPVNLEVSAPYMTAGAFTDYAAGLIGLVWRGGHADLSLGDPRLEAWDTVQITDTLSNTFILPCMSVVHIFDGGLQTSVDAPSIVPPEESGGSIIREAQIARAIANDARKVANNYLSSDNTGVMVADMTDGVVETPSEATTRNVFITAGYEDGGGVEHPAGTYVRDGQETLARFGETTVLGKEDKSHLEIDENSLEMLGPGNEGSYAFIGDLRGTGGQADITEGFLGDGDETQFQVTFTVASVTEVAINGSVTTAYTRSGRTFTFTSAPSATSDIEIKYRTASANAKAYTLGRRGNGNVGGMSVAENSGCIASGNYSHAEGLATEASGKKAHSEGEATMAVGEASHAEGYLGRAIGKYAHAGGYGSEASGTGAFAHGCFAMATGSYSTALGREVEARGANQTVVGRYNKPDPNGKYAFIVGNGSDSSSNAFAVGWDGSIDAPVFKIVEYSYAYTNLAAGAGLYITANDFGASTPSGYRPAAVLTCNSGSAANCSVVYFNGAATGTNNMMRIVNTSTAARSYTARITILYVMSSMVAS